MSEQVTKEEAQKCDGHHFPNFCDCFVYELEQKIIKQAKVIEAAKVFYEIKEKKRIAVINGSPNRPSMFEIANAEMAIFKALDELERE